MDEKPMGTAGGDLPREELEAIYPLLLAVIRSALASKNLAADVASITFRPGTALRLERATAAIGLTISPCEPWQKEITTCESRPDGTVICKTDCLPKIKP